MKNINFSRFMAIALLAVAVSQFVPSQSIAEAKISKTASTEPKSPLFMVSVDRALLNGDELSNFEQFISTANLPKTAVGKRCQYYKRPLIWCLILVDGQAKQLDSLLRTQPFHRAVKLSPVRRL